MVGWTGLRGERGVRERFQELVVLTMRARRDEQNGDRE